MDSDGGDMHLATQVGDVLGQCEVCRAVDRAPRAPIAGASTASQLKQKLQVDLLFSGELIARQSVYVFSEDSLLIPVRSGNPRTFGTPFGVRGLEFLAGP